MLKKFCLAILFVACAEVAFAAAAVGNCMEKAKALAASQTVTLVNEWDTELGDYLDMGVYYYKVRLTKGYSYSIWISGGSSTNLTLDVATDWEDDDAPWASFDYGVYAGGARQLAYLDSTSWDEDDPSYGTYYVCISGDIGEKTTLYFQTGWVDLSVQGEKDNPRVITISTAKVKDQQSLLGGEYYYQAFLTQGLQYRFATLQGTETDPLRLSVEGIDTEDQLLPAPRVEPDSAVSDIYNQYIYVYPAASGNYSICVWGNPDSAQSFKLGYQVYPARKAKEHPYVALNDGNGYAQSVVPGRRLADVAYYDGIIDESLCQLYGRADERWVIETQGAKKPIQMEAYKAGTTLLATNNTLGFGSYDTRTVVTFDQDANFYIGVCQPSLTRYDAMPTDKVKVFAYRADSLEGSKYVDAFDASLGTTGDDEAEGASQLTPYPASKGDDIEDVGFKHGPHVLSARDWVDWYVMPCRKGLTYSLKAVFEDSMAEDPKGGLKVTVYYAGDWREVATTGTLTPKTVTQVADVDKNLEFTPTANGMYYVRVSVAHGDGLDYPSFNLYCMVYGADDLGLLNVRGKGASTTWRLAEDLNGYFNNGATIAYPIDTTFKVKPTVVSGYVAVDVRTNVVAWTGNDASITYVTLRYDDTADPADNEIAGNTWLNITSTEAKAKRTLWEDDPVDYFAFKGKAGYFYNLSLEDKTEDGEGDATFSITARDGGEPLCVNGKSLRKFKVPAEGKYDIAVTHEKSPAVYSKYFLYYSCVNVGTVQFAAPSVTVTEASSFAELTLTRTESTGAVSVHFATQVKTDSDEEYQAKPGSDYYPTNGIISWADGDKDPKTIKIKLIPDLVPTWNCSKKFNVKIWPLEDDAILADEEYPVTVAGSDTAVVKITETKVKSAGTIKVLDQPLSVKAGATIPVRVAREGGADGRVAVLMKTLTNADVVDDVDLVYLETNLVWEAGDSAEKIVDVTTLARPNALQSRLFNMKFTVQNAGVFADCDTPLIEAVKVPVTIGSALISETASDLNDRAMVAGAALSYTGTWYVDSETGRLTSETVAEGMSYKMRFNVTGPAFLVTAPKVVGGKGTIVYQVGSQAAVTMGTEDQLALTIPEGETTVMFKIKDSDGKAQAEFADMGGGLPFRLLKLDTIKPVWPCDSANVRATDLSKNAMRWSMPEGGDGKDALRFRMWTASLGKTLLQQGKAVDGNEMPCPFSPANARTYCWMLEVAYGEEGDWVTVPNTWKFSTVATDAPTTVIRGGTDAFGNTIIDGGVVELVKGVLTSFELGAETGDVTGLELVAGELPPGMALKQNIRKIKGVPTSLGDFTAVVRVVNGTKMGTTMEYKFHVSSLETAAGNFTGVLMEDGEQLTNGLRRVGRIIMSCSTKGVVAASVKLGGSNYSFSANNLSDVLAKLEDQPQTMRVGTTLTTSETIDGIDCLHTLEIDLASGSKTNLLVHGCSAGKVRLTIANPDGGETVYVSELVRQSTDNAEYLAALSAFSGYYTMSLVPGELHMGWPTGNGYLTFTVNPDATVTGAGMLADGNAVSLSTTAQILGNLANPESCRLRIPVWAINSKAVAPYSFGGVVEIKAATKVVDGIAYNAAEVNSLKELCWSKDSKYATYDQTGFTLPIRPTGGWYNTIFNLQRYYLDRDFTIEAESLEGLPEDMLPAGSYVVDSTPNGVVMTLEGDDLAIRTENRERDKTDASRYDFGASVNPWKTKVSFARETGVLSGTFQLWTDDGKNQASLGLFNHYGVLLMNRDAVTPLDEDVWTAGFYLVPINSKRVYSFPFNIKSVVVDRDWNEAPVSE